MYRDEQGRIVLRDIKTDSTEPSPDFLARETSLSRASKLFSPQAKRERRASSKTTSRTRKPTRSMSWYSRLQKAGCVGVKTLTKTLSVGAATASIRPKMSRRLSTPSAEIRKTANVSNPSARMRCGGRKKTNCLYATESSTCSASAKTTSPFNRDMGQVQLNLSLFYLKIERRKC